VAKRTRQRQLKKLYERRLAERRRRQRIRQVVAGVLVVALIAGAAFTVITLLGNREPSPSASPSPSPVEQVACGAAVPPTAAEQKPTFEEPPRPDLREGADYRAVVRTSCGTIELDLFERQAPIAVNSFVFLAEEGFFDGVTFHRVIEGFVIQGGDPEGTGSGGPGYEFEDEFVEGLTFDRAGLLAMAHPPGRSDANGSQFFITVAPAENLNELHTIFGRVAKGMNVVRRINQLPTDADERPIATVYIESVRIEPR
jgi:cyclophilin family peptidyl-prolyl cis-trans isomerase